MIGINLVEDMHILLENSLVEPSLNYYRNNRPIFKNDDGFFLVDLDLDGISFTNKQVNLLKACYFQINKEKRSEFIRTLEKEIDPKTASRYKKISFSTLIHIGESAKAISFLTDWKPDISQRTAIEELLEEFIEILKYEWTIFNPNQIRELSRWTSDVIKRKNKLGQDIYSFYAYTKAKDLFSYLHKQLNILSTRRVGDEILGGYNPEINEDKEKLIEQFKRYDFPVDLSQTLEKIDQKLISASDTFDYKGTMDLIRSFTERFFESIALSLDAVEGKKVKTQDSEKVADFFMSKKLIGGNQAKLLTSLRHFLSNEASHKLKSKPEDARLSRNLTIEFSLYLLQRLKDIRS